MIHKGKKYIAILLLVNIFVPQVSFAISSGSVVSDPPNLIQNIGQFIKSTLLVTKEYGLDTVAFQLSAMAGSKMSNAIFNNAAGGASGDGESQIISNFTTHLQKIDDTERKKFITALQADAVNNPYAASIAKKFTLQGQQLAKTGESLVPKFSLPQVAGPNWRNISTDIGSAGGWNSYIALALPQNNPYGAEILASEELARKIGMEREAEKLKLMSPGINSSANSKQCELKFSDYKKTLDKSAEQKLNKTQGDNSKIKAQITNLENQIRSIASTPGSEEKIQILQGQIIDLQEQITVTTQEYNANPGTSTTGTQLNASDECIQQLITNPVSTASSLLDAAATYGIDKSRTSNGFGDVFLSLFMTMAQSFIKGGLSSWRNGSGGYSTTIRDTLFVAGPEDQIDGRGNIKPISEQPFQVVDLVNDFPYAYQLTKQDIEKTTETLKELRKTPERLANLDICVPGPDYKYQERFEKYYQEKLQIPWGVYSRSEEDWERAREEAKIKDLEYSKKLAVSEMKSIVSDPVYNIPGAEIFRSAVSEFGNKKIAFDQNRRSLIEKNSALSGILGVGQQIKTVLTKIANKEQRLVFYKSANMDLDRIVVSSKDWGSHTDISGNTPSNTATGLSKSSLVKWAKCMELSKEKWSALNQKKIDAAKPGATLTFTKSDEFMLEKYRACYL